MSEFTVRLLSFKEKVNVGHSIPLKAGQIEFKKWTSKGYISFLASFFYELCQW